MNFKKAILASMIVSSMLVAVAGPIPAGAEAAQEQKQTNSKKVQIDKTMAVKLQKAVKQFAGKEIKLQNVAESLSGSDAKVTSVDGKYIVYFNYKEGVESIDGPLPLDKISKETQDKVLKALKKAYAKKTYVLDKEAVLMQTYDGKKEKLKDFISYKLTGKDFEAVWRSGSGFVSEVTIKLAKEDLDSKWLETAAKAIKTAFDHDLNVTEALLVSSGENYYMLSLEDNAVSLVMDAKKGKIVNVFHNTRKKVTTDQRITAKDAKEVVAPLAKELFNIDIAGYEVKWDNTTKDYRFVKGKETIVRAALDAEKNAVYIISDGSE
ncbi:hypothetical protein QJQ58_18430 [Paenibacillus dendritiformis]|uniref:hypothetical protein n=1 Tax=Paenibacillus dendritiformis TaxID=130049 RepID=UPI00248C70CF|nr:hypothetical protein [Paenibacillus dendritiformis]WGU92542.1 hypothetical protein QJQ58_18430 [Paenibacillus dendritiformis]